MATETNENESLVNKEKAQRDAEVLANLTSKFGRKPFGFKKPTTSDDGQNTSKPVELNQIQNGNKNNESKPLLTQIKNGDAFNQESNNNNNNNNNVTTNFGTPKKAADRFREAGMKARLARRMEKILDERMTVKQIFNRYVDNSTLHGFRYVFMNTYPVRRFLWLILLLAFASIFLNELKNSILLFYEYPFTTTSTIEYVPELKFPAISICNLNQFDESFIENSKLKYLYEKGVLPFEASSSETIRNDINGNEFFQTLDKASQKLEELFQSCEWKSRDTAKTGSPNICSVKNFTAYHNLYGQKCFIFNSGELQPILHLNETGLNMALKIEFDLKTNESLRGLQEFGLKIVVHDQEETPLQQAGFVVSPGFQSFVELKVRKTENLKPPYATRCGSASLSHFAEYRQSRCFFEQLSHKIEEECNCRGQFMLDKSFPYCSMNETINCLLPVAYGYDRRTNLDCPVDCETTQYITSLSYAKFLTQQSNDSTSANDMSSSYINKLKETMSGKKLKRYIEDNVIVVQFFYQEMKEENVVQEPSYDFYKLVGDVGGQLGLMLGASVLTLVEFVDLFLFTLYHQILRLWRRKKREEEKETD